MAYRGPPTLDATRCCGPLTQPRLLYLALPDNTIVQATSLRSAPQKCALVSLITLAPQPWHFYEFEGPRQRWSRLQTQIAPLIAASWCRWGAKSCSGHERPLTKKAATKRQPRGRFATRVLLLASKLTSSQIISHAQKRLPQQTPAAAPQQQWPATSRGPTRRH